MKIGGEGIVRRRYGELCRDATDGTTMVAAMSGDVREHFLAGHASLLPIGEREPQALRQKPQGKRRHVLDVPAIRRRYRAMQLGERGRFACINRCVGVRFI